MNLRLIFSSHRARPWWRLSLVAVVALALLSFGRAPNDAGAASSDYSSTLYLTSTASSQVTGSYQLVTTAPGSANTATQNRIPLYAAGTCDVGCSTGYQDFQPGVKPANNFANTPTPTVSASITPNNKGWIVDGSGAVSFAAGTWQFQASVKENSGTGEAARLALGMWKVTVNAGTHTISSSTLLVDPNCSVAGSCTGGAAPGDTSGDDFITSSGSTTATLSVNLNSFSLASGEHLYVQLWRHQTTAFTTTIGVPQRTATLTVNDGVASIAHPAATALPNVPTRGAVAARVNAVPTLSATYSDTADTGTVSIELCSDNACHNVLQGGPFTSGGSLSDGQSWSWTPGALADGTYWWSVSSQDLPGDQSGWSTPSSFVVDTVPPGSPTLDSPAAGARVNSTALSATFVDSDATDSGTVTFRVCSSNDGGITCSSELSRGTSSVVGPGATASWTAPSPGPDGTYYWQAQATDVAGNATAGWTALRKLVLDTTPPATPVLVGPADAASLGGGATLTATFENSDATDSGKVNFQVCSNSTCATVVASGSSAGGLLTGHDGSWALSGLADGSYYWRAQSQDAAGNMSAWASSAIRSFAYDGTPPTVTPTGPASGLNANHLPALTATYSDTHPDSLTFEVCSTSACTSVVASTTFSGLASSATESWTPAVSDGAYYWRVRGTDSYGNTSAWSAASSFRFDDTPPQAPVLQNADGRRTQAAPVLSARIDDPGDPDDSLRLLVQVCADPACGIVTFNGYSGTVPVGSVASVQAPPEVVDGTYYWRAFAEDAVGNQSAWSPTRSFVVDTVAPDVPTAVAPADGTVVNGVRLSGTFVSSDPTDSGTVDFQLCADTDCADVISSGSSASVDAGATATWTIYSPPLDDGTYYWRAYGEDEAGNDSAWSPTWSFTLDQTPPARPQDFHGGVLGNSLVLRWRPLAHPDLIRGYALLVNGRRTRTLKPTTSSLRIRLRHSDRRTFAVVAIDAAGNMSRATPTVSAGSPSTAVRQARVATDKRHHQAWPAPVDRSRLRAAQGVAARVP